MDRPSKPVASDGSAPDVPEATDEEILREMIQWFRGLKACPGGHSVPEMSAPGSQNTSN